MKLIRLNTLNTIPQKKKIYGDKIAKLKIKLETLKAIKDLKRDYGDPLTLHDNEALAKKNNKSFPRSGKLLMPMLLFLSELNEIDTAMGCKSGMNRTGEVNKRRTQLSLYYKNNPEGLLQSLEDYNKESLAEPK